MILTFSGDIKAHTAVDPDLSSPLAIFGNNLILLSKERNPDRIPDTNSDLWNSSACSIYSNKCSEQYSDTFAP